MSGTNGTCEYVLDPDDPETWGGQEGDKCYVEEEMLNEDGVWTCPHDAEKNENLCIFHMPTKKKDDDKVINSFLNSTELQPDEMEVVSAFDTSINDSPEENRLTQFIGCKFGKLDISGELPHIVLGEGGLDFSHAQFSTFDCAGLGIASELDVEYVRFNGATFSRNINLNNTKIDNIYFKNTDIIGDIFCSSSQFKNMNISNSEFNGSANFSKSIFKNDVDFSNSQVRGELNFIDASFSGEAIFSDTIFTGPVNFRQTSFDSEAKFQQTEFRKNVDYVGVTFSGEVNFRGSIFNRRCDFSGLNLSDSTFTEARISNGRFVNTKLQEADFESSSFSNSILFGADLRGAQLAGATLGDVQINDHTIFLGHPSDDSDSSPHTLSAIWSRPTCVYDPDYEKDDKHADVDKAQSVYRALEELGGKHARPRLQAHSFVRRKDLQKNEYKQDAKQAESWEERFIAGARWSRAQVARATLLYGESPWRVILWSLGIILFFAFSYPVVGGMKPEGGDPITYAQIVANPIEIFTLIYYSTLTYTALGFGDFQPVGLGRLLTTVETGLGAVMLALLVFILGRRAAR